MTKQKKLFYSNNKTCVQYKTKTASLGIRTLQSTFQQVYYESVAHWNLKYKFCTQLSQLISFKNALSNISFYSIPMTLKNDRRCPGVETGHRYWIFII